MKLFDLFWSDHFKRSKKRSLVYALSKVSLFSELSKEELKNIARIAHIRKYKDQELVFGQGDPAYGLYIVLEGEVDIFTLEKRKMINLGRFIPFGYFGEVSLSNLSLRKVSAVCNGDTIVCFIFKEELQQLFMKNPSMCINYYDKLVDSLTERLEYADRIIKNERN